MSARANPANGLFATRPLLAWEPISFLSELIGKYLHAGYGYGTIAVREKYSRIVQTPPAIVAAQRREMLCVAAQKLTVQNTSLPPFFVRLFGRAPSGRAIAQYLSGRDIAHYFNALASRAQKGYLRISLTRFASCIEKISPAIAAAPLVWTARAPGNAPRGHTKKLTVQNTSLHPPKSTFSNPYPSVRSVHLLAEKDDLTQIPVPNPRTAS